MQLARALQSVLEPLLTAGSLIEKRDVLGGDGDGDGDGDVEVT